MLDSVMRRFALPSLLTAVACTSDPGSVGEFSGGSGGDGGASEGTLGATSSPTASASAESGGGTVDDSGGDGPKFDLGVDTGGPVVDCGEPEDNPIYVLTRGLENGMPDTIYGFDPQTLTFTSIVEVICEDTAGRGVSSMAVDRHGRAWIEWSPVQGAPQPVYLRVDILDLATGECIIDQTAQPGTELWGTPLGMAFVSDAEGSAAEQLFFVDTGTSLYSLANAEAIGQYWEFQMGQGTEFSGVELTGTGEGRLFNLIMNWAFEWDHPCTADDPCYPTVHLGEVNKLDGTAISNVELPDVEALGISPGGFAFAHWGGRFWIFSSDNFGPTRVYDYDPITNTTVIALEDGPDGVVGAGVSTCAPTVFPEG